MFFLYDCTNNMATGSVSAPMWLSISLVLSSFLLFTFFHILVSLIRGSLLLFPFPELNCSFCDLLLTTTLYCTISFNSSVTCHTPFSNWRTVTLVPCHTELVTNLLANLEKNSYFFSQKLDDQCILHSQLDEKFQQVTCHKPIWRTEISSGWSRITRGDELNEIVQYT